MVHHTIKLTQSVAEGLTKVINKGSRTLQADDQIIYQPQWRSLYLC